MSKNHSEKLRFWRGKISNARCSEQHRFRRELQFLGKNPENLARYEAFEQSLTKSLAKVADLEASSPVISYPSQLPVSQRKDEIAELIKNNQVVILAGETGSGKTTQLPKICLELGYGNRGLIGHTQPRRIAARTVADRIASELGSKLGNAIGYHVRFKDVSGDATRVKLMTDGVLLAEFQRDRFLSNYEVIIIDEAHERSLNIDFLLGLLKPLCKHRPDLKLIITSATIDLEKFANHFARNNKPAPIIEVSGRTFPVTTIYQAPERDSLALPDLICDTVCQVLVNEAKGVFKTSGDILIFCAGEREIRDTALALRKTRLPKNQSIEVLPLYSRLSIAEQNRVFAKAKSRKVVLATNVAETSITVPGISYVIDPGLARISRYSFRSKVQRLPVEAISQASANQRKGRCGRVSDGVCIRLYSEEDFGSRAEFTPAEIVRSNLASVILKMLRLRIPDIDKFEFIDKPDNRLLNDGYKLLDELGAIDAKRKLTKVGRAMSDLPVDPRYARILAEAQTRNCLRDALIVVSALSIQDPRERPADKQQAADQSHALLLHPTSDFSSYLLLWQVVTQHRQELSNSKFKKLCTERFWSIARIFEWRELYRQLAVNAKEMGWKVEPWVALSLPENPAKKKNTVQQAATFDNRYKNLHQALLSGLLSNVSTKGIDDKYIATRSRAISLFPGSAQSKRKPKWLVAAAFIETKQVYAHTIAEIKPDWILQPAAHLCRYSYGSTRYHARSGMVKALRKTLLYGLTIRDKQSVNYASVNASEARTLFIQQALVERSLHSEGTSKSSYDFYQHNLDLINDIEKLEIKTRRRNLLVNEQAIFAFYDSRIPNNICTRAGLDKWLNPDTNKQLKLNRSELILEATEHPSEAQFPDAIEVNNKPISLIYKFDPGQDHDGVTMLIPISLLAPFPNFIGDWLVPGLLREKCTALIKTLPKPIRRNFAPAADAVDRVFNTLNPSNESLLTQFANALYKSRGVKVEAAQFDLSKLDGFYKMNYRIVDVDGSLVEEGRDLDALKQQYASSVKQSVHAENSPARKKFEQHELESWSFGELASSISYPHQGMTITAYPMLMVLPDNTISLLVHDNQLYARYQSRQAVVVLAQKVCAAGEQKQSFRYLQKELLSKKSAKQNTAPHNRSNQLSALGNQLKAAIQSPLSKDDRSHWVSEIMLAALRHACFSSNEDISSAEQFEKMIAKGAKNWVPCAIELEGALLSALEQRDRILKQLNSGANESLSIDLALEDIKAQIYHLFDPEFLRYTELSQLKQYPRYLRAIELRLEKLSDEISPQQRALYDFQEHFSQKLNQLTNAAASSKPLEQIQSQESAPALRLGTAYAYFVEPELRHFAIALEEWRVSLFAQNLRTQFPVSEKRLRKLWQANNSASPPTA